MMHAHPPHHPPLGSPNMWVRVKKHIQKCMLLHAVARANARVHTHTHAHTYFNGEEEQYHQMCERVCVCYWMCDDFLLLVKNPNRIIIAVCANVGSLLLRCVSLLSRRSDESENPRNHGNLLEFFLFGILPLNWVSIIYA